MRVDTAQYTPRPHPSNFNAYASGNPTSAKLDSGIQGQSGRARLFSRGDFRS